MFMNTTAPKKELTGYPSVDKPWMKYYPKDRNTSFNGSLYDCLTECNENNLSRNAFIYFGKRITFSKMIKQIDSFAEFFKRIGIKPSDKVVVLSLNTPDVYSAIYALNKMGAVCCLENVTQPSDEIKNTINNIKAKYAVVLDIIFEKYQNALLDSRIEKIFLTRMIDSMPTTMKFIASLKCKRIKNNSKIIHMWKVKNNCTKYIESYKWDSKDTAIILSTSGTTGIPKKAELSNCAINSFPMQSKYVDVGLNVGSTMLTAAPPFVAFGISATVHMPLCNGVCVILAVNPDPKFVAKQFLKFKPNLFMCGPAFIDEILKDPQSQDMDCSFVSAVELGGEAVAEEYLDKINSYLKSHNSRGKAFRGYSMTELSACSVSESNSVLKPHSVGIPLCDVTVKVVDNETGQELSYGHEGELLINSPSAMNKYFGNDEETLRSIVFDDSGNKWIKSGDLAKIDEDGFVYIVGRIKRMSLAKEIEHNTMVKLFPDYIEHILSKYDKIEKCAVIVLADDERVNAPIAFIKVKDKCKVERKEIDDYIASQTGKYNIPKEYYFIDSFPLLSNGKIDYMDLENIANKKSKI